jgi:hypothetical protein
MVRWERKQGPRRHVRGVEDTAEATATKTQTQTVIQVGKGFVTESKNKCGDCTAF